MADGTADGAAETAADTAGDGAAETAADTAGDGAAEGAADSICSSSEHVAPKLAGTIRLRLVARDRSVRLQTLKECCAML